MIPFDEILTAFDLWSSLTYRAAGKDQIFEVNRGAGEEKTHGWKENKKRSEGFFVLWNPDRRSVSCSLRHSFEFCCSKLLVFLLNIWFFSCPAFLKYRAFIYCCSVQKLRACKAKTGLINIEGASVSELLVFNVKSYSGEASCILLEEQLRWKRVKLWTKPDEFRIIQSKTPTAKNTGHRSYGRRSDRERFKVTWTLFQTPSSFYFILFIFTSNCVLALKDVLGFAHQRYAVNSGILLCE